MKKQIVVAVANNKGGTGKTTITLNLAAGLQRLGNKVLMVDLDAQANLTSAVGFKNLKRHVGQLLIDEMEWDEVILKGKAESTDEAESWPQLDLLPAARTMVSHESALNASGAMLELRSHLEGKDYDYVLIDCPPSLAAFTTNALAAADYYLVPMQGENFAYIGLDEMLKYVTKLKRNMRLDIKLAGIVKNKFNLTTTFARQIEEALANQNVPVFKTAIRQFVGLMECTVVHKSIFDYAPKSNGAADFSALVNELIDATQLQQEGSVVKPL